MALILMGMTRNERRRRADRAAARRMRMLHNIGPWPGLFYARHIAKVGKSAGFLRNGHLSHYASVRRKHGAYFRITCGQQRGEE